VSRRLRILATIILVLFAVIVAQSANIQFFRSKSLDANPNNPSNTNPSAQYPRGEILASNGDVLAYSVKQNVPSFPYRRVYPKGSLTSGVVGYVSRYYGVDGIEQEYNSFLAAHSLPPQSFEQLLAPTSAADSVTLTLDTSLQAVARAAMGKTDGAAVALDPKTGAVLVMYSNPNYNPVPLTSPSFNVETAARNLYNKPDGNGFAPFNSVATGETFPPGSTFKVITTAAAVVSKPADLTKDFDSTEEGGACAKLPDSDIPLCNSGHVPCGGDVTEMLPPSCDPGFALLGIDLGADYMFKAATSFGYDAIPPLDLPGTVSSYFPTAATFANNIPFLAYSSIGQGNVRATALQDALVAAAVGNGGVEMTPHLMDFVTAPDGQIVERYKDSVWKTPLTATQAAFIVPLMEKVVSAPDGTAAGVGFPAQYDVAAKTGTAQTGNKKKNTDDWLIAFAPATDPTIAIAVVVPYQPTPDFGATIAGPIVKALIDAYFAQQNSTSPSGTTTTTVHK
jgi:penicillin-binding protein A